MNGRLLYERFSLFTTFYSLEDPNGQQTKRKKRRSGQSIEDPLSIGGLLGIRDDGSRRRGVFGFGTFGLLFALLLLFRAVLTFGS